MQLCDKHSCKEHIPNKKIIKRLISAFSFKQEMKVSTAWRARHASMIPMFAETQSSNDTNLSSLLSYTQGGDVDMDTDGPGGVQATQANVFSATQAPGNVSR